MNYRLNDMVFLVDGRSRSCIYDLNTNKLYSIGKFESKLIKEIIKGNQPDINNKEKGFINTLFALNLLTYGIQDFSKLDKFIIDAPSLEFAWLEITQRCNFRCLHCYNLDNEKFIKDMSMDDFKFAIDKLVEANVHKIQLIGGEPLITKQFITMVNYAYDKFEISIFTNSYLLDEEKILFLKGKNIKQICTTIFSYLPSEHDKVTNIKGSHEKSISNLKKLRENGFDVEIFNVKMNGIDLGNKSTDLYDLAKKTDFVRICGKGNLSLYSKNLLKEKLITKQRFAYKLNSKRVLEAMNFHHCFANKVYIDVDLNVYPCAMERKLKYGNLRDDSLINLHNEKIYSTTKNEVDDCKYCEYRYACPDCRADSLNENFYEKPWFCTYDPLKGVWSDPDEFAKKFEF